jgi:23S rRNA pseudouridine1911/1915/1917 synthase
MPLFSAIIKADAPKRLDLYIAENLSLMSRSQIKARNLTAVVNSKTVKNSFKIKDGDKIELTWSDTIPLDFLGEDIPLNIIYEDKKVIVVNKEQGMVVHPAAGNWSGTLANALLWHFNKAEEGKNHPFIVHRLDKDTSGVIIAAKDLETLTFLQDEFKTRRVKKTYIAITNGAPSSCDGTISTFITRDKHNRKCFTTSQENGKLSVTKYRVLQLMSFANKYYSLLLVKPKTGRTHQIRVHLKHIGCPILGDPIYNIKDRNFPKATLMLHARRLKIKLSENENTFNAPLPKRFLSLLKIIKTVE